MIIDKCLLINLSFPRDDLSKAQLETTGNAFGQCLSCILWCVAEPVWASLAAHGLTLIHRMLPYALVGFFVCFWLIGWLFFLR